MRRTVTVGVVASTLVAAIVAVIWAAGGFATGSNPFLGTRMDPGEFASTRFWDVAINDAEVSHASGEITLDLTVVNKQRRTAFALTDYMLGVRLPNGRALLQFYCVAAPVSSYAPLVPVRTRCTFGFERNEVPPTSIPGPGPVDIQIVILDQQWGDSLRQVPQPEITEPAAWVPLQAHAVEET